MSDYNTENHEAIFALIDGHEFVTDIGTNGYAEPGYTDPESGIIVLGNWNDDEAGFGGQDEDGEDQTLSDALEALGAEIEWLDEWDKCADCGKMVRTSPDSYGWQRSYWLHQDGDCICSECVLKDPSEYLESLEGQTDKALTFSLDLSEHGYRKLDESYENGLYGGQADEPGKIGAALEAQGITRYIFEIDSVGQFDLRFSVWVHEDESLDQDQFDSAEKTGVDPAREMEKALRGASSAYKVETREVSADEFVSGRMFDPIKVRDRVQVGGILGRVTAKHGSQVVVTFDDDSKGTFEPAQVQLVEAVD